jgi:serine/threonine-protein kinase RsbW
MTGATGDGGPIPELDLEVPPKPAFVRTARHAAGAVARMHDLPDDLIEDIKLAVSEACNTVLAGPEGRSAEGEMQVVVSVEGDKLLIDVVDPAGTLGREVSGAPGEIDTADLPFDQLLAVPIIRGLVDEIAITEPPGGGVRVRMSVSVPRDEE